MSEKVPVDGIENTVALSLPDGRLPGRTTALGCLGVIALIPLGLLCPPAHKLLMRWASRRPMNKLHGHCCRCLARRQSFSADSWGHDVSRVEFARELAAFVQLHANLPNNHLLPKDQLKALLGFCPWSSLAIALEGRFGFRPPCDGLGLWAMTFGELVDYYAGPAPEYAPGLRPLRHPDPLSCTEEGPGRGWIDYIPIIGIFDYGPWDRTRRAIDQIADQLRQRESFPHNWGGDSERLALVRKICGAIKEAGEWPNDHFLPDDPMGWLSLDEEPIMGELALILAVEKKLQFRFMNRDVLRIDSMTLQQFVESVEAELGISGMPH